MIYATPRGLLKVLLFIVGLLTISACGDFPDYRTSQSSEYCEIAFPFAGGHIDRKYVGYFRIISSLQFIDADPEVEIVITGPSHIELEPGSVQRIEIKDKRYIPQFTNRYFQGELGHYGRAFVLSKEDSTEVYNAIREGYDISIFGRIDVGQLYETKIYNFFFDRHAEPFDRCVDRLLTPEDYQALNKRKALEREKAAKNIDQ